MASLFSSPSTHLPTHSPPPHSSNGKPQLSLKSYLSLRPKKQLIFLVSTTTRATDNGSGLAAAVTVEEEKVPQVKEVGSDSNGSPSPVPAVDVAEEEAALAAPEVVNKFADGRWVNGTWDLKQFQNDGKTHWDSVIDAEAKRRKWLQDNPESSSNDDPVLFDTSIVPWWAWIKRYHLPEAELLNGRAAMIGFFMAYFVDSLTGVGLVDQMGNFFCKTLLFVAVAGVLVIRKNEDIETIKKLVEESTFYDKQWQATWQDENSKKDL